MVAAGDDALAAARLAFGVGRERSRFRKHRATRLVEVAGQHVEHVDQPAGERAVGLGASAQAAVDRGALRLGERACKLADVVGGNAAAGRHGLR